MGVWMRFFWRFLALFLIGSSLVAACSQAGSSMASNPGLQVTQTMQAVGTQVRQTLQAAAPEKVVQATANPMPADTPTPAQAAALTPTAAPITPTASTPSAHVNTNTNCRSGPSTAFNQLYVALKGEDLKIVARTSLSDYVLVENLKKPGQTCWLWTKYVDVSGDLSGLPQATPPPTPTPVIDFSLNFTYMDACVGKEPEFKLVNTGEVTFKAAHVVIQDLDTSQTFNTTTTYFNFRGGCTAPEPLTELAPGKTGYVFVNVLGYDPGGHHLGGMVTLCSQPDMTGSCVTKEIKFTPK